MHVRQIRESIDSGKTDEAHDALDQLLALGPQNTEALKLRASLYESEGRFVDEARVWDKVSTVDREDPDAIAFLLRRQLEDREHFYFTDDVPGGGRRFMAYPRRLINNSALGLIGCIAFLLSTRVSVSFPVFADPSVMISMFGVCVLLPWLSIMVVYFRSIRSITLNSSIITVSTRLRAHTFQWQELERVCLARTASGRGPYLSLVLLPKDRTVTPIEIDLNQGSTAIRARSYLIREIARLFCEPEYLRREALDLERRKVATY